jgi:hypothetical protein
MRRGPIHQGMPASRIRFDMWRRRMMDQELDLLGRSVSSPLCRCPARVGGWLSSGRRLPTRMESPTSFAGNINKPAPPIRHRFATQTGSIDTVVVYNASTTHTTDRHPYRSSHGAPCTNVPLLNVLPSTSPLVNFSFIPPLVNLGELGPCPPPPRFC